MASGLGLANAQSRIRFCDATVVATKLRQNGRSGAPGNGAVLDAKAGPTACVTRHQPCFHQRSSAYHRGDDSVGDEAAAQRDGRDEDMADLKDKVALIIGVGPGLSASIARTFAKAGMKIALAARSIDDLAPLAAETGAATFAADAADVAAVKKLFADVAASVGEPYAVVFNPSYRTRGPLIELDPNEVAKSLIVSAYGGFLVGQEAARRMLPKGTGAILFTGASASVKGYAQSAPFAMGKFALRGLAQSMARELAPQGIHVAHVVVDGGIASATCPGDGQDQWLNPDAIAESYLYLLQQHRSCWTWEIEVRPWLEKF
jgi:NAD(P)-dependent dehydrogenase (short-subunit alcohol dehydrogenase family)